MKRFNIKNRKGQELPVRLDGVGNGEGLVFLMPGLGASQNDIHISFFRDMFIKKGLAVVSLDVEHTFGVLGKGIFKATATNYLEDLEDVLSWSSGQDWYDEPFYLLGHSLGALCAGYYAVQDPKKVKALFLASAVVSYDVFVGSMTQQEIDEWARGGILLGPSTVDISEGANRELAPDLKRYDLLSEADRLKMPVILMVGDRDEITKKEQLEELFKKLPGEKQLHIIKGADHVFDKENEFSQISSIIHNFLKKINE